MGLEVVEAGDEEDDVYHRHDGLVLGPDAGLDADSGPGLDADPGAGSDFAPDIENLVPDIEIEAEIQCWLRFGRLPAE